MPILIAILTGQVALLPLPLIFKRTKYAVTFYITKVVVLPNWGATLHLQGLDKPAKPVSTDNVRGKYLVLN